MSHIHHLENTETSVRTKMNAIEWIYTGVMALYLLIAVILMWLELKPQ